jgi:hypothetical protein
MPTEYRRVVFPNHELRQALAVYHGDDEQPIPPGEIVAVAILDSPANTVRITLLDTAQSATFTADFSASHIAAALIRYCIDNRVPIPKDSRKSLRLMGDNLALDIVVRERKLVDIPSE